MGLLVDGKWVDQWYDTKATDGQFKRQDSAFRSWITTDGSTPFAPEAGRYHLYISHACPWAHRALIFRKLKGLEEAISLSIVDWFMGENGWEFGTRDGAIPDPFFDAQYMHQIYTAADPNYTGRVTVPVLWDKQTKTIVSNESSELIRMFNSAFDGVGDQDAPDFYPESLRDEIDEINEVIYHTVNNGVYKSGFATTQAAYEDAVTALFATLDMLEERLTDQRYLVGNQITEADWRLFTTLVRFDPVYVGHFKCNIRRIADYPALANYLRDLYQMPGIADTVDMHHIKNHYYQSHESVNPTRIVPVGPDFDLDAPHNRGEL